jgi:hypothetical protein
MKPTKVAIGDTFIAQKGEGDTSFCPFEILLVNSAGDEGRLEIPRKSLEIPPTEDSGGLAIRQSVVL